MPTPQKPPNPGSHVHFNFGNEKWVLKSSYQDDYSCAQGFPTSRSKKMTPPKCAEVIPHVNLETEKSKWLTSTRRDFAGFGADSRRQAYETSQTALKNTKALHTRDSKLLRGESRFPAPVVSRNHTEFNGSFVPVSTHRLTNFNNNKVDNWRHDHFISEARHAFQWPSSDRLKPPPHFRGPWFEK